MHNWVTLAGLVCAACLVWTPGLDTASACAVAGVTMDLRIAAHPDRAMAGLLVHGPPAGSVLENSAHRKCVHFICSLEEGSHDTRAYIVAREKAFVCASGVWPSQTRKILAGEWPVGIGSQFQPGTLVSE